VTVNEGENVSFTLQLTGSEPFAYQWCFENAALLDATNRTLTFGNAQWVAGGNYSVVITNPLGAVTSAVARLRVNRYPVADASATAPLIVSPNGTDASVLLNGSRSSDPDGDLLSCHWLSTHNPISLIATGAVAAVVLPVGIQSIDLAVSDGLAWDTNSIAVEIITAAEAVNRLAITLRTEVPRAQPLVAALNAAVASLDRSNPVSAINQLLAFQNQVRAQVSPLESALGASLIQRAQEIIDNLTAGGTNPGARPHGRLTAVTHQANGPVRMEFEGERGVLHLIEASTNLVDWELIGAGVPQAEGGFEFEDPRTSEFTHRFYRVRSL
jgi:hypothetical protein